MIIHLTSTLALLELSNCEASRVKDYTISIIIISGWRAFPLHSKKANITYDILEMYIMCVCHSTHIYNTPT